MNRVLGTFAILVLGVACGPGRFDALSNAEAPLVDDPSLLPARLVAPLPGANVRGAFDLVWTDAEGGRVELCRTRDCASPTILDAKDGPRVRVPDDLEPGTWFWRVRARAGNRLGAASDAAWSFVRLPSPARGATSTWQVDVNGDARADVVTTAEGVDGRGRIYVYFAQEDGSYPAAPSQSVAMDGVIASIGVVDVDGDGLSDVVAGSPASAGGRVIVFRGTPAGIFDVPSYPFVAPAAADGQPARNFGRAVSAAGDLDGDGHGDVVVASDGCVFTLRGGKMGFTIATATQEMRPAGYGVGIRGGADFDGDGLSDVLIGAADSQRLELRLGEDVTKRAPIALELPVPSTLATPTALGQAVVFADLDGDGHADAIAGDPIADGGLLFLARGARRDASATHRLVVRRPFGAERFGAAATVADSDGDGLDDVLVGAPEPAPGAIFVVRGTAFPGIPALAPEPLAIGADERGSAFGEALATFGSFEGRVVWAARARRGDAGVLHVFREKHLLDRARR